MAALLSICDQHGRCGAPVRVVNPCTAEKHGHYGIANPIFVQPLIAVQVRQSEGAIIRRRPAAVIPLFAQDVKNRRGGLYAEAHAAPRLIPRSEKENTEMYSQMPLKMTLSLLALTIGAGGLYARAADPSSGARGDGSEGAIKVIPLAHADATDLADVVRSITPHCNVGVDLRTNSLAISGQKSDVRQSVALIEQLDKADGADAMTTEVFRLRKLPDRRFLHAAVSQRADVAVDRDTKLMVARGSKRDVEQVRRVIDSLIESVEGDKGAYPTRVQLSFYFIQARTQPDPDAPDGSPLPEPLKPVAESLAGHGFQNAAMLASLLVHTKLDSHFELEGKASPGSDVIDIELGGTASSGSHPNSVDLALEANLVAIERTSAGEWHRKLLLFQIETEIHTRYEQYVVLAASPSIAQTFDADALVVYAKPTG